MSRDDTSVATSIQHLLEQEDQRRTEQVRLAYQPEQQHEFERLTIIRDRRVNALEGQRLMFGALLGTLTIGAVVVYAFVLSPYNTRQSAAMAQLEQEKHQLSEERRRERSALEQRASELEGNNARLSSELEEAKAQIRAHTFERTSGPKGIGMPHQSPPKPHNHGSKCIDPNDPLCDDLGGR